MDEMNEKLFSEEDAQKALEKGKTKAKELLEKEDKLERFLQHLERKLQVVPMVGDSLSSLPVLAGMIKAYAKKEYRHIPMGSILAILSALGYFVAPIDIIPDILGALGYLDDAAVVLACWRLVESDAFEYLHWRREEGRDLEDPALEEYLKRKGSVKGKAKKRES